MQQHVLVHWPRRTLIRVHEAVPVGGLLGGDEQKRDVEQATEVGEQHERHLGRVDDRVDRQQPPLHYSLVTHGVVLYMMNDLQFSLIGLICMLINMVSAVGERIVERRLLAVDPVVDASKMALVLLTNLGGLFYVTFLLIPTQETSDWDSLVHTDEGAPRPMYQFALLGLSCVAGVAIGYAGINAQRHLTATSFLVVGNVNKFVVIFVGMAFMSEASSWQAVLGCIIAISGGIMYALARNRLADKIKAQKAALKKQDTAA